MSSSRNVIASVKGRLLNISRELRMSHQLLLLRYFQERFLYRLSQSPYKLNFCLKGGALLYAFEKEAGRVTKDIDFLGVQFPAQHADLVEALIRISNIPCHEDGVTFDGQSIQSEEIIKDGKYNGIRIFLPASLGNIRERLKIDFGFGDVITPFPQKMRYPVILDLPAPEILAYSLETTISEKFEAMISLAEINTRMKDFYDVYHLLLNYPVDLEMLEEAIKNTFEKRATILSVEHSLFSPEFTEDSGRNQLWKAWLKKSNLDNSLEFSDVMQVIIDQLFPIAKRIAEKGV